ncbi:MAG: dienelactone hydrolase family protein [Acidobacteriota bacterium]|nr:dienelactone hydrolase family protein [Acidobacteriota bacterium]
MFDQNEGPVDGLVHLYVDGAFSRRELVSRVAKITGSTAAALAALSGYEVFGQTAVSCPADVRVPEDAPDVVARDMQYTGDESTLLGYLAYPAKPPVPLQPGIIVVHENRGLTDYIKDVTRRVARAGFVGLAPDLLSRQGGTGQFADAAAQAVAYSRTTASQRSADLYASLAYIKTLPNIVFDHIGALGFCAGGGNVWNFALGLDELLAAVPFYGTPLPPLDRISEIKAPVLALYAEQDRNLTIQMGPVMQAMLQQNRTFGFVVYQGVGHAFHNDTGPAYNPEAACDAWARAMGWFNKYLRR